MNTVLFNVSVDVDNDYIGDYEIEIPFEDDMYARMIDLAKECRENGVELSRDVLDEKLHDVYMYIFTYVDDTKADHVDADDEDDLDAFWCSVDYPDDLCDVLLDE